MKAFDLPDPPPLCGEDWLQANKDKYTMEDIEAQSLEISSGCYIRTHINAAVRKGAVSDLMKNVRG